MLMKRDEDGEIRPSREELEGGSFDDVATMLADGTITRARAIKLAGAALLAGALSVLWPAEADARKKKRRRRRRRRPRSRRPRRARVSPSTVPAPLAPLVPYVFNITNPSNDKPLTISGVQLLGGDGGLLGQEGLDSGPVTIQPNTTAPVTVTFEANDPLVDAESLRLIDGRGVPITLIDDGTSVEVGDIDVVENTDVL